MKFLTAVRYGRSHVREWFEMKIAWALPHGIAKWAMIRVAAHATTGRWGNDSPGELTYAKMHDRWEMQS
jgi:hypothetical protein